MERVINLPKLLSKSSHFLFGARGSGKSYQIRSELGDEVDVIDLLRSETYLSLSSNPSLLENMLQRKMVVIDEIQRIPELLNEVHRLIEEQGIHFLLTGSSARQLKRKGVNLLAGRALRSHMFPLTWQEIQNEQQFDLKKYLLLGGLPKAYLESVGQDYLFAYVETYLKEEIQAEALVRNLSNYHRFLKSAAFCNTEVINFTKVASDAQLSANTVRDYFQILEDTLVGYMLPPWKSSKRKAISSAKFYFFDPGVSNAILNIQSIDPLGSLFGKNFEQFIVNEIKAYLSYKNIRKELFFWRSQSKYEVDIVLGDDLAIEIKSSEKVSIRDHKGLKAISEEQSWKHLLLVSQDTSELKFDSGITHIHWKHFLQKLWNNDYVG